MDRRRFFKQAGMTALAVAIGSNTLPVKGDELFYNYPDVRNNTLDLHPRITDKIEKINL